MSITYTASTAILNYNFGKTGYTVPASFFVGLSTGSIAADGTGAVEPSSGSAYARVEVVNNKTNFSVASTGSLVNATAVTFPESTGSWGTITHVFLADALTSGNIWYYESLTTPKLVQTATIMSFAVGGLVVTMTN